MTSAKRLEIEHATNAKWIVDSDAATHIANDKQMFTEIKTVKPFPLNLGDKSSVQGLGRGDSGILTWYG